MRGRITGWQFFLWFMPTVLLSAILKFKPFGEPFAGIVSVLYLISIPIAIVAAIGRSHDLGRSGWFALIAIVPFAGWYLVFKHGEPGPNKYGWPNGEPYVPEVRTKIANIEPEGDIMPLFMIRITEGEHSGRYIGNQIGGGLGTNPDLLANPEISVPGTTYALFAQERPAFRFFEAKAIEVQALLVKLGYKSELVPAET